MTESHYFASMRRDSLRTFFDASPTARLLRSDHAPLVLEFLNRTFKTGEAISLGQLELRSLLADLERPANSKQWTINAPSAETREMQGRWWRPHCPMAHIPPLLSLPPAVRVVNHGDTFGPKNKLNP